MGRFYFNPTFSQYPQAYSRHPNPNPGMNFGAVWPPVVIIPIPMVIEGGMGIIVPAMITVMSAMLVVFGIGIAFPFHIGPVCFAIPFFKFFFIGFLFFPKIRLFCFILHREGLFVLCIFPCPFLVVRKFFLFRAGILSPKKATA